ncbi:hypothetical protein CIB84_007433, partial [Bambusicola thoracicus]
PQQDFAFSIDRCSDITTHTFDIRAAMVLRQSIKELYVKLDLIINGKTVLSYSDTLCGPGISQLIFCGKKKGGNLGSTLKCLMATEYSKQDAPAVLLNAPIYCNVMFTSTAC